MKTASQQAAQEVNLLLVAGLGYHGQRRAASAWWGVGRTFHTEGGNSVPEEGTTGSLIPQDRTNRDNCAEPHLE